jgi:ABC-2 type transport system permease protein
MQFNLLWYRIKGFVAKDIKLFLADRQAVVMSIVVPVMIASILGFLDSNATDGAKTKGIKIDIVDLDHSETSRAVVTRLAKDKTVIPTVVSEATARKDVKDGTSVAAFVLPSGFGELAGLAFSGDEKPKLRFLTDPAKPAECQIALGTFMQQAASAVAQVTFGELAGDATAPFEIVETRVAANGAASWSAAAHDYAGFGMQGLLFFAMEAAIGLARERRHGIWRRLRAAPIPTSLILLTKGVSTTLVAFLILAAMFSFGALVFHIRVLGSGVGFLALTFATSLMAATFGLLLATLGKTETQSRGISILLILVMLAIGGAWFPMAKMPPVVQTISDWLPVRWAVEGFDGATWRGAETIDSLRHAAVLSVFSIAFAVLALLRLKIRGVEN